MPGVGKKQTSIAINLAATEHHNIVWWWCFAQKQNPRLHSTLPHKTTHPSQCPFWTQLLILTPSTSTNDTQETFGWRGLMAQGLQNFALISPFFKF